MAIILEGLDKKTGNYGMYVSKRDQKIFDNEYERLSNNTNIPKQYLKNLRSLGTHTNKSTTGDDKEGYNKKTAQTKANGSNYITAQNAKKRLQRWPKNNKILAMAQGGQKAKDLYKKIVSRANSKQQVKKNDPVKPPTPTDNSVSKPEIPKAKVISMPKGKIKLAASVAPKKVMDEAKKIYITEEQVLKIKDLNK